ncbi:MAG: hypothetical protein ACKPKO_42835, partial [Candidatus Fonsibacter sp.]
MDLLQKHHRDMATTGMLFSTLELCMSSINVKFANHLVQHDARLGDCEVGIAGCARLKDFEIMRNKLDAMLAADYLVDVKALQAQVLTMSEQLQEFLGTLPGAQHMIMQHLTVEVSRIRQMLGVFGVKVGDAV